MSISPEGMQRDIGSLEAEQKAIQRQLLDIRSDIISMREDITHIKEFVSETKGGHKYLWGALALAAALGAVVTQLINVLKFWQ